MTSVQRSYHFGQCTQSISSDQTLAGAALMSITFVRTPEPMRAIARAAKRVEHPALDDQMKFFRLFGGRRLALRFGRDLLLNSDAAARE